MLPGAFALLAVLRPTYAHASFRSFYPFLPLTSRHSREKMYQALPTLPYCKRRKARRGTGNEGMRTHNNMLAANLHILHIPITHDNMLSVPVSPTTHPNIIITDLVPILRPIWTRIVSVPDYSRIVCQLLVVLTPWANSRYRD